MAFSVKKTKNFNVKPDEIEVFVSELKRQQALAKKPKAAIYRSGRAPSWVNDEESSSEDESSELMRKDRLDNARLPQGSSKRNLRRVQTTTIERHAPRQIQQAQIIEDDDSVDETTSKTTSKPTPKTKKQIPTFDIDVSALEVPDAESDSSSDDDDVADTRRARARERAKLRKDMVEEEEAVVEEEAKEEEEDEESGSSEYETDSEDEIYPTRTLLKPVFVSKKERETIAERERLKQEQLDMEEAKRQRLEERKKESRQMVVDELEREEDMKRKGTGEDGDEVLPSDDDDDDEEEEFKKWKIRELRRIKRDLDEREKLDKEEAELERRRHMTDEELKADNLTKAQPFRREKGQYRFLQKYYHPGAFYRGDIDNSFKTVDFSAPTGADRTVDRTLLPQVLQVKKFGLKGRTKYTHLVDQDTTGGDANPWGAAEDMGMQSGPRGKRMAGTGEIYRSKKRRVTD